MSLQNEPPRAGPEQAVSNQKRRSKSAVFYIGIFFNIFGSSLILGGLFSDRWVVLSEARFDSVPSNIRLMLTSHFGPWKACRYDGRCGDPWKIVAGVDQLDLKLIQLLISVAVVLHIGGIVILCLKCWPLFFYRIHWFIVRFNSCAVAEILIGIATMLTIIMMFVMGQMKRRVILRHHQLEHAGYSFLITLIGVLFVVLGIMTMAFSSTPAAHTWLPEPSHQLLRWLDSLRTLRQRKTQTSRQLASSSYSGSNSSQMTITCISPTNTFPMESRDGQTDVKQAIEVVESSSDAQRPEDDFLLINTHSSVDAVSPAAAQLDLQCDEGATMDYEFDGRSSLKLEVEDLSNDVGEDDRTKDTHVKSSATDNRDSIGLKRKMPAGRAPQRSNSVSRSNVRRSNVSSIFQTAKRCATETFARPFQSTDRKGDGDENSSYPGNSGIAVLKFVDV